jgi:hypothetical protein
MGTSMIILYFPTEFNNDWAKQGFQGMLELLKLTTAAIVGAFATASAH